MISDGDFAESYDSEHPWQVEDWHDPHLDCFGDIYPRGMADEHSDSAREDGGLTHKLDVLLSDEFSARFLLARPGREELALREEPTVIELSGLIRAGFGRSEQEVSDWLDRVFSGLRAGEVFQADWAVMAILVALEAAHSSLFDKICTALHDSKAPEIINLRRMASRLRAE